MVKVMWLYLNRKVQKEGWSISKKIPILVLVNDVYLRHMEFIVGKWQHSLMFWIEFIAYGWYSVALK